MSCKKCGNQYCWVCKDPWTGSHYNCSSGAGESSQERADAIARRIDTNLTFRQMFVIHLRAKKFTDMENQEAVFAFLKKLVSVPTTTSEDIEALFLGLEISFLSRHVLLKLCVAGKHIQEHKLPGSGPLKKEIRRIGTQLSFMQSCLEARNIKNFKRQDILDAIVGMKSAFLSFLQTYQIVLKGNKTGK